MSDLQTIIVNGRPSICLSAVAMDDGQPLVLLPGLGVSALFDNVLCTLRQAGHLGGFAYKAEYALASLSA